MRWLKWEIRLLDPSILFPGDDRDNDIVVSIVADELIGASTEDAALFVANHQERIDALRQRAERSDDIRLIRSKVCLTRHAGGVALGIPSLADTHIAQAKVLDRNAVPLDDLESRRLKRVLRKRIREARREIADRKGFAFPTFGLSDIAGIAAFSSLLLLTAGHFRVTFLLRAVGLDAGLYFSITDYLAATASTFWALAVSAVSPVVSFLWGFVLGVVDQKPSARPTVTHCASHCWLTPQLLPAFTSLNRMAHLQGVLLGSVFDCVVPQSVSLSPCGSRNPLPITTFVEACLSRACLP